MSHPTHLLWKQTITLLLLFELQPSRRIVQGAEASILSADCALARVINIAFIAANSASTD